MKEDQGGNLRIGIIGGGAAGFFAAIHAKAHYPTYSVTILEKTSKLLAKVRISGGGRCNVTNGSNSVKELASAYPRGNKFMKKALLAFNTDDTKRWFEKRGVALKTESDNRVFPVSDNSESVINCLMNEVKVLGVKIITNMGVRKIESLPSSIRLTTKDQYFEFDKVVVATGGWPKLSGFSWLSELGHTIVDPLPSLFTFNMPSEGIRKLMGVVASNVTVSIQSSKLKTEGPLLITHWGMSGPAILRLSAFGARFLADQNYNFKVQVNWANIKNAQVVFDALADISLEHPKKYLANKRPFDLPERLWLYMLDRCLLKHDKPWQEIGKKGLNKLAAILTNDIYSVNGKTTFKEEFVTCGGVSLSNINSTTMESLVCPNLYFAGEVLDIDGITGGYNFQAAWTTGFLAGTNL